MTCFLIETPVFVLLVKLIIFMVVYTAQLPVYLSELSTQARLLFTVKQIHWGFQYNLINSDWLSETFAVNLS